jgi:uncharacterized membrane protein
MNGLLAYLHPAVVHFPIALLVVSVALDFAARRWPALRFSGWVLLALGALATIPATITGIIAHLPYEETEFLPLIERHQYTAFAATGLFLGLAAWRWRAIRRGDDIAGSALYSGLALVGLVLILATGLLGGGLVYDYGIGVRGVER